MALRRTLEWVVTGDARQAQAMFKQQQSAMDGFASSARRAAVVAGAAFATERLINFGGELLNLNATMGAWEKKASTVFADQARSVERWADKLNERLGLSDERLVGLAGSFGDLVKPMGFTATQTAEMTTRAGDLAAALAEWSPQFGGVEDSLGALGAALTGEREQLKKYGIVIDENRIKQELAARGLQDLTGDALRQAEAQVTLDLAWQQSASALDAFAKGQDPALKAQNELKAAAEELKQSLAENLGPVLTNIAEIMTGVLSNGAGQAALAIGAVGTAAFIALPAITSSWQELTRLADKFNITGKALLKSGLFIAGLYAAGEALDALGLGTEGVGEELDRLDGDLERFATTGQSSIDIARTYGRDLRELGRIAADANTSGFESLNKGIDDFFTTIVPGLGQSGFSKDIDNAREKIKFFDEELSRIFQSNPEAAFELLGAAAKAMGISVDEAKEMFPGYADAVDNAKTAAAEAGAPTDEFGRAIGGVGEAAATTEEALKSYNDTLRAQFDPIFAVADAQSGLTEAIHRQAEVYANAGSTAADLADADRDVMDAVIQLDGAATNLNTKIADGSLRVDEARNRFIEMATQQGITAEEAVRLADQFGLTADAARDLGSTDPTVTVAEVGATLVNQQLAGVKLTAESVPRQVSTNVFVTGTEDSRLKIITVRDALGQLQSKTLTIGVTTAIGAQAASIMSSKMFRQHGGPVEAGMPYIVGEKRPELFVPNVDGQIIDHVPRMTAMGGSAGGTVVRNTYILNVQGSILTEREVIKVWRDAVDRGRFRGAA